LPNSNTDSSPPDHSSRRRPFCLQILQTIKWATPKCTVVSKL
jgi:hypothetical protein